MDNISLSRTIFEIFHFKVFRVWPMTFDPKWWSGVKKCIPFESPYTTSYLTSMDNISLSRTVFEIFDRKVFRVWPWPLTPNGNLGSKCSLVTCAHTKRGQTKFSNFFTMSKKNFGQRPWPNDPLNTPLIIIYNYIL